jgi:hypothetical protein
MIVYKIQYQRPARTHSPHRSARRSRRSACRLPASRQLLVLAACGPVRTRPSPSPRAAARGGGRQDPRGLVGKRRGSGAGRPCASSVFLGLSRRRSAVVNRVSRHARDRVVRPACPRPRTVFRSRRWVWYRSIDRYHGPRHAVGTWDLRALVSCRLPSADPVRRPCPFVRVGVGVRVALLVRGSFGWACEGRRRSGAPEVEGSTRGHEYSWPNGTNTVGRPGHGTKKHGTGTARHVPFSASAGHGTYIVPCLGHQLGP